MPCPFRPPRRPGGARRRAGIARRRAGGGARRQGGADQDARPVQMARSEHAAATNKPCCQGDPNMAGSLFVHINTFQPGQFGDAHYHPNDRFIAWSSGAAWRGTGTVVDPACGRVRVPKGTFMIDQAGKVHWDGTKEESGAYFISEIRPGQPRNAKGGPAPGPAAIRRPPPSCCPTRSSGRTWHNRARDPCRRSRKARHVCADAHLEEGQFQPAALPPERPLLHGAVGTWWVGTGNKFDPEHLAVPVKAGSFATEAGKEVHWAGARDAYATILIFGQGPIANTEVEEAK